MPDSTLCLTFDFDALSVWFGYGPITPARLHRGEYGVRVGLPRVLELLRRHALPATFFVPGHTLESFPEAVDAILSEGHELAHHSYAHQDPSEQTPEAEHADMERALAAFKRLGLKPLGYRSPSADLSDHTLALVEEFGFLYDSSLMGDDFRPYHPRICDLVGPEQPLMRGHAARLWELPLSYECDDWVHFQFNFEPYENGTAAPSKVLEIWQGEFEWMHTHVEGGILTLTLHPQVIGRAHRLQMLEAFIRHCMEYEGVHFERMGDVARQL